jgi:hypothetical protein
MFAATQEEMLAPTMAWCGEEMFFLAGGGLEIKMLVERSCLLVNRVDENCTSSYDVLRLSDSRQSIF